MKINIWQSKNVYMVDLYAAVPLKDNLVKIISTSDHKEDFFPIKGNPDNLTALVGVTEEKGNFVSVEVSKGKYSIFDPDFYQVPDMDLSKMTTLHLVVRGDEPELTGTIADDTISLFESKIDLQLRQEKQQELIPHYVSNLDLFTRDEMIFRIYSAMKKYLLHSEKMQHKAIRSGSIPHLFAKTIEGNASINPNLSLYSPEDDEIRLIQRHSGNIVFPDSYNNNILEAELALVYFTGKTRVPGVYGVFIMTKQKDCPPHEIRDCDQAKSYAGIFLKTNSMVVGGLTFNPLLSRTYAMFSREAPANANCCGNLLWFDLSTMDLKDIRQKIPELNKGGLFQEYQLSEIEGLTDIVYSARLQYLERS